MKDAIKSYVDDETSNAILYEYQRLINYQNLQHGKVNKTKKKG